MTDWTSEPPITPPTEPPGTVPSPPTPPPSSTATVATAAVPPAPSAPVAPVAPVAMGSRRGRRRTIIGVVLALVAGISAIGGLASFWTTDEVLSKSTWQSTSKAIVDDPKVQQDIADAIAQQIVDSVGLESFISGVLPGVLSGLSGTITDKATELLSDATVVVVRTQFFADLWQKAVAASHDQFVHAIDGSGGMTTITSRGLELDLGGVVSEIRKQLDSRGVTVLDRIDTSNLHVTYLLVDAPGLESLRSWVRVLRVLDIILPAIAVITAIAAVVVARRRSFAVAALGAGGLLGAGLVTSIGSLLRSRAIDEVSGGVISGSTATIVVDHVLAGLDGTLLVASAVSLAVLVVGIMGVILSVPRRRVDHSATVTA